MIGNSPSSSSSTPTSTETTNQQVQGGSGTIGAGGVGNAAVSISSGAGSGSISYSAVDPGLVAAAEATTLAALQTNYETSMGSLAIAAKMAGSAAEVIGNKSETPLQQLGSVALPIVAVIAVAVAIYYFSK